MSTTARRYWLKALRAAGVRNFRAKSGLGLPFICHLGDRAGELPFYDRRSSAEELSLMADWCRTVERPVIFDVGANNGFIATQLAQLLKDHSPLIYAFEPIPSTFTQLRLSVEMLGLQHIVRPICCALSDKAGVASLAYNPRESLFAQVRDDGLNQRVGSERATAATITLDEILASLALHPTLLKVDVEGFEPRVLAGAKALLVRDDRPAICFEWNPLTMSEVNSPASQLIELLAGYRFFYVDDFGNQRKQFAEEVSLGAIDWVCNVFAVPVSQANKWERLKVAGDVGAILKP